MPLTIRRMEVDLKPEPTRGAVAERDDDTPPVPTPLERRREAQLDAERRERRVVD